jgi:hypothetical protein
MRQAHLSGTPVVRGLVYGFPADPTDMGPCRRVPPLDAIPSFTHSDHVLELLRG